VNEGERVSLRHIDERQCVSRWRLSGARSALDVHVTLGRMEDGRWWVESTAERSGGWVFVEEADAWAKAEQLRAERAPAGWSASGAAADGEAW
jgi:hypothetical protein